MDDKAMWDAQQVSDYIDRVFPQAHHGDRILFVESVANQKATVRMVYHERSIRPGGTISGPAMFTLAFTLLFLPQWVP